MKNSKSFATAILLLSAAFVFTLTSCQKDEMISPNAASTPPVDQAANIHPSANTNLMMTIMHESADRKDQMIEIFSTGELIATEYQNGAINRRQTTTLTSDQLTTLRNKVRQFNFSTPKPQRLNRNLPTVSITFRENPSAKSIRSAGYDHGDDNLSIFARQLEESINISELFSGRDIREPLPVYHN